MQSKQVLVVLSGLLYSLGAGFSMTLPMLLNEILYDDYEREDSGHLLFLSLSKILASGLGFLIVAVVMQIFGRKFVHIVLNVSLIISLALLSIAKHISVIYLAQVIQGITATGVFIEAIILSEYCDKKRRGLFLCLEKTAEWFGAFLCHYFHGSWTHIYLPGLVPPCVAIALTIFWPESPYFHAINGRYEECEKSFQLLHGQSDEQRRELQSLITAQQKKIEHEKLQLRSMISNTLRKFLEKSFWKVFLIIAIVTWLYSLGDLAENFYSFRFSTFPDIYESYFYFYLFMSLASLLSCFIILIERRTILLVFGSLSVLLLFLSSILAIRVFADDSGVVQFILILVTLFYNFFINLSILPVCGILFGELYFLEHKGIGVFASGSVLVVLQIIYATTVLNAVELRNSLLNTAWFTVFCLTILFFILPETTDKTLQEIEDELRGDKRAAEETCAHSVPIGPLNQQEDQTDVHIIGA